MQKLSTASEFHSFETSDTVVGKFVGPVARQQDSSDGEHKAGEIIGFEFENENGESFLVSNSWMIENALKKTEAGVGCIFGIRFKGQTLNAKNQKVNKFEVILFDGNNGEFHDGWAEAKN